MFTIDLGKIFLETYNQKMGTNLCAEEMFDVIAKVTFTSNPHEEEDLISWGNLAFSNGQTRKKDSFEKKMKTFKDNLKTEYGVETALNVFGGCAVPIKGNKRNTTEPLYCDNIHFTHEERFLSFIGSLFLITVNGYDVAVYDRNIIWKLWESINKYREFLTENKDIKGNQIGTWNALYLYNDGDMVNIQIQSKSLSTFKSILGFLEILYKYGVHNNIKGDYIPISMGNFIQLYKSCGWFTIDKGIFDDGEIIYNLLSKDNLEEQDNMTIEVYEKFIDMSWTAYLKFGCLRRDMLNPDVTKMEKNIDYLYKDEKAKKEKIKYKQIFLKYMKNFVTQEETVIADGIIDLIKQAKETANKSLVNEMSLIREAKTFMGLIDAVRQLKSKTNIKDNGLLQNAIKTIGIDRGNTVKTYILCNDIFIK